MKPPIRIKVTPCLGKLMDEQGIKQNELAELTGLYQGTISRFDKQSRHSDDHVILIARALNVPIERLFCIEELEEA